MRPLGADDVADEDEAHDREEDPLDRVRQVRARIGRGRLERLRPRRGRRVLRVHQAVGAQLERFARRRVDGGRDRGQMDRRDLALGRRTAGGGERLAGPQPHDDRHLTLGRCGNHVRLVLLLAGRHPAAVDEQHASVLELERHEHLVRRGAAVGAAAHEKLVVGEVRRR